MNYIKEINEFEKYVENNYISATAQLLWYKLMKLFNKSCWKEYLVINNSRLMNEIGIKREASFICARKELIDSNLIEFWKGKKGSPNKYRMITFVAETSEKDFQIESEKDKKTNKKNNKNYSNYEQRKYKNIEELYN